MFFPCFILQQKTCKTPEKTVTVEIHLPEPTDVDGQRETHRIKAFLLTFPRLEKGGGI